MRIRPFLAALSIIAMATLSRAADAPASAPDKFDKVGVVQTGMMAIGGETTSVNFTVDKTTYELDGKNLDAFNGKKAHVTGTLTIKQGVEIGQRMIVKVETIEAVKE